MDREIGTLLYKKSALTKILLYGIDASPHTDWPDDFAFDWDGADEAELQAVLNAAENQDALFYYFKLMRLKQAGYECQRCGSEKNLTIHHIIPRSVRKENTIENTAVICRRCHDHIEFAYDMIRLDRALVENEYHEVFTAWMDAPSTQKFLQNYFKKE